MTNARRLVLAAVVAALLLALRAGAPSRRPDTDAPAVGRAALSDAAPSVEALVGRFLEALATGDRETLERLRVSEAEYRGIIVPGSVAPGEPPQLLSEEASRYFWQDLDARSTYSRNDLLRRFAGKPLALVDYRFDKGTRRFANHTAHRRLVVNARDGHGEPVEIRTGSIVDVDGGFKFVSFVRG